MGRDNSRLGDLSLGDRDAPGASPNLAALLRHQAEVAADAIALDFEEEKVTYAELIRRARAVAAGLRARGLKLEDPVGLCLERSVELIVATLGVLEAGGFYVPIERSSPSLRLEMMLADVGARILVAEPGFEGPSGFQVSNCGDLEAEGVTALARLDAWTPAELPADALAYVIYTSGSTGRPKGVAVTHRGVIRLVLGVDYARLNAKSRFAHCSNVAFDAATLEIWGALANGGCLVGVSREQVLDPAALAKTLAEKRPTQVFLTTAVFNQMARSEPEAFAPVEDMIFGGEAGDPQAITIVRAGKPPGRLVNAYGPTECTALATTFDATHLAAGSSQVPIGRPLPATTCFVVDAAGREVAPGEVGELLLGGAGLARGYVGRAGLTADRFVPDPFSGEAGARLYKTGDLVRQQDNGALEFLGRRDHQIKLRGVRIELGEIEAALLADPEVAAAVVLMTGATTDERRLVAFVSPAVTSAAASEATSDQWTETLRARLERQLPSAMVPSGFVALPKMPVNTNGKIDRQRLADLASSVSGRATGRFEAPIGPIEETLAAIWAEVLRLDSVGRHDDFQALGGHSLLAAQVRSRLRARLGVELPLAQLFATRTLAALAAAITGQQRAEIEDLPLAKAATIAEQGFPLSFQEQRLWFLDRFLAGSAAYNIPLAIDLSGPSLLDRNALAAALDQLIDRHEILRSRFVEHDGAGFQVVGKRVGAQLAVVDLEALATPAGNLADASCAALSQHLARTPLTLARPPHCRFVLLTRARHHHTLLAAFHHAIFDGWSVAVLLAELAKLYDAHRQGHAANLPELPLSYGEYAAWQRDSRRQAAVERDLDYWRRELAGVSALELPTDRPRSLVAQTAAGRSVTRLPKSLRDRLATLARAQGVTLFSILLGGFAAFLGRLAGAREALVGYPAANRNRLELEGLVGFFVNTLAARVSLGGSPGLGALAAEVNRRLLAATPHQDVPLDRLVAELGVARGGELNPLLTALFVLQSLPPTPSQLSPGLELSWRELDTGAAVGDLVVAGRDLEDHIELVWQYRIDLWDTSTIERWSGDFATLLTAATRAPEQALFSLPWLGGGELQQLAREWNDTAAAYPDQSSLGELFGAYQRHSPDAMAVAFGERWLSYGELARRAEAVAAELIHRGLRAEEPVALCLERSVELVVATLGVVLAGGAYVPLDRDSPPERLALVLDAVGARWVIASPELEFPGAVERLAAADLEASGRRRLECSPAALNPPPPLAVAAVIFTSGSTGRPKGVALTHRGLARLVRSSSFVPFAPGFRVAHCSNVAFDAAVLETWGALANGGCLVGFDREDVLDPARLAVRVAETQPDYLLLTSAVFHLVAQSQSAAFLPVVHLGFGGEAADPNAVARVLAAGPPRRLINAYGPTEGSAVASCFVARQVAPGSRSLPIGRPISNTAMYICGERGEALPLGAVGELLLGGPGVARGYVGRPALSAESFVPDAFSGEPGARLYRTGDLARLRSDGLVEFLGRRDHQVKLRGFRIELGEVEAAISSDSEVALVAVLVQGESSADRRLVAYLVPRLATALEAENRGAWLESLRQRLDERLPPYMVPTAFALLPELPVTANGKIDRRALARLEPTLEASHASGLTPQAPPQTPTEHHIAAVWAEVLPTKEIGRDDDFFALGGHSLVAVRVQSRLRDRLGLEIPLTVLFNCRTPASLGAWVDGQVRTSDGSRAITRRPAGAATPASFAQARLWFLDRLDPGSPVYNVPVAAELRGPLAVAVLWTSLAEIVRRHETLHTVFVARDGEPWVELGPERQIWPVVDLSLLDAETGDARARHLTRLEAGRSFELARGPVLRLALLRLGPESHRLLLTVHHICADAWSFDVLWRELTTLYAGTLAGQTPELAMPPIQYGDYALWQRNWLSGAELERKVEFWRRELAVLPPPLELPTDRPRPAAQSHRGAVLHRPFAAELGAALGATAAGSGVSSFLVAFAAYAAVLGRWAGQHRFAIGAPVANRGALEVENLIGFFINSVVLVAELGGEESFASLLEKSRDRVLAAFEHQDLPFEKLVDELAVERDLSRSPIFDVVLSLDQGIRRTLELAPGTSLTVETVASGTTKWDLSLLLHERNGALSGDLEYSTDLFDEATVSRLAGHFETLLSAALAAPHASIWHLPLLTAAERLELERIGDGGALPAPADTTLYALVASQAAKTPQRIAVVGSEEQLSYGELLHRAHRLATSLAQLGLGPERVAAVLLRREPALLVSLLAVQATGGAYLPLDPDYPADRLAFMLEDSQALVMVSRPALSTQLELGGIPVLAPEEQPEDEPQDRVEWSLEEATTEPRHLAYLIYTSGSTGRPKGVAIEHRSAVDMVRWASTVFSADELSGSLAATSVCFDLSIFEIFLPLATGGTVILADNALALRTLPHRAAVRLVNTVPSALAALIEMHGLPAGVRTVNLAGEPLPGPLAEAIYQEPGVEKLYNLYGPSEDTTYSTFDLIESFAGVVPAIGRPIAGSEAWVVDRALELLPRGVPGELCLAGRGLARGYLGRPGKTAESFLPNPFAVEQTAGTRMYRTGDRVRYRPDGRLDFLGRLDRQIKLRGFRIELGELEATLGRLPGVKEGAVGVITSGGEMRLVAWAAPEPPATADAAWTAGLAQEMGRWLPAYMVPSAWVPLSALPRNPNGKIDRKMLPSPEANLGSEPQDSYVAPRTEFEELVADIWREVLGVERVGVKDSFFALGGHSLAATKAIARLEDLLGLEIPVRVFFEAPTVERLVETLVQLTLAEEDAPSTDSPSASGGEGRLQELQQPQTPAAEAQPAAVAAPRQRVLPMSLGQRRLWVTDRLEPGRALYNMPFVLELEGPLNLEPLGHALTALVARHESLRTTFEVVAEEPLQRVHPPRRQSLCLVELSALGQAVATDLSRRLARIEARLPFDLERGPLLRSLLLRLAGQRSCLLLTCHHIVSDGWSLDVMVRDLAALYVGRALPPLPLQYGDFALRQLRSDDERERRLLDFWRRAIGGTPPPLDLPTDHPRPAVAPLTGNLLERRLGPELGPGLRRLCGDLSTSPFLVGLAATQVLLSRWAGVSRLLLGTPVAGRSERGVHDLVGFFVNSVVIPSEIDWTPGKTPSFAAFLTDLTHRSADLFAHQDLPFERLVETLVKDRDRSRSPIYQVAFASQSAGVAELAPGLTGRRLDVHNGDSKWDLLLVLEEQPEGWRVQCEYATALFNTTTITRLLAAFERLLVAAVTRPRLPISELPWMAAAERHGQLVEWNDHTRVYPSDTSLWSLFTAQARRAPEAVAVVFDDEHVSYGELDTRARTTANQLVSRGLLPGAAVALAFDRSLELVVATLAVAAAGGTYVPLDRDAPPERLATVLSDVGARWVFGGPELDLPAGVERLNVTANADGEAELPGATLSAAILPGAQLPGDAPAYVIFTSGSTGRPKGVLATQRGVARLVLGSNYLELHPGDRVAHASNVSFDAATFELWGALLNGACLVNIRRDQALDPAKFAATLAAGRHTVLFLTTALFNQVAQSRPEAFASLDTLLFGGEACDPRSVARVLASGPPARLLHVYGPTENTTFSTWQRVHHVAADALTLPIGAPIANTTAVVLDRAWRPVPMGAVGELFLGGPGLALGYHRRGALTAERFIPDGFGGLAGERLYKTGDLVRQLADGAIEFIGRRDHQVKLRGFRIELAEIEAALEALPEVDKALALLRQDRPGEPTLAAYLKLSLDAQLNTEALRHELGKTLPRYALPAAFIAVSDFPLNANGKIDRAALPVPSFETTADFEPPRTEIERQIADIWGAVLGTEQVGLNHSFWELGGQSLLATKVTARVQDAFGIDLPISALFDKPRLGEFTMAVVSELLADGGAE